MGTAALEATNSIHSSSVKKHACPHRFNALVGFANVLKSQYQLHGTFGALEKAIEVIQEAMQLEGQDRLMNFERTVVGLNQFALMMRLRYFETGEINDLDTCLQRIKSFLDSFPEGAL